MARLLQEGPRRRNTPGNSMGGVMTVYRCDCWLTSVFPSRLEKCKEERGGVRFIHCPNPKPRPGLKAIQMCCQEQWHTSVILAVWKLQG